MGFFKGLGKALGSVGKVALKLGATGVNVATGGLLDKAHSVAKTLGLTGGQRKQAKQMRVADQALATKLVPTVKRTEIVLQDQQSPMGVRKRNPVPVVRRRANAMPGSGRVIASGSAGMPRRRRKRAYPDGVGGDQYWQDKTGMDMAGNPVGKAKGRRAKRRSAKRSTAGGKRSLPPAMQARANRMKQMAADWRAAGKPGRWIDWVKANG